MLIDKLKIFAMALYNLSIAKENMNLREYRIEILNLLSKGKQIASLIELDSMSFNLLAKRFDAALARI